MSGRDLPLSHSRQEGGLITINIINNLNMNTRPVGVYLLELMVGRRGQFFSQELLIRGRLLIKLLAHSSQVLSLPATGIFLSDLCLSSFFLEPAPRMATRWKPACLVRVHSREHVLSWDRETTFVAWLLHSAPASKSSLSTLYPNISPFLGGLEANKDEKGEEGKAVDKNESHGVGRQEISPLCFWKCKWWRQSRKKCWPCLPASVVYSPAALALERSSWKLSKEELLPGISSLRSSCDKIWSEQSEHICEYLFRVLLITFFYRTQVRS